MKKPQVIDLFSGCGGMSLGFEKAGFEILAAFDHWKPAVDVYRQNFSHPIFQKDLSDLSIIADLKSYNPDLIIGGPPCQDFSIAGNRHFEGKRANLTIAFSNIVTSVKPKCFVMENVYNIEKSGLLPELFSTFQSAGYGLTKGVFDSSFMGVPQSRKRYFLIGKLDEKSDFMIDDLLEGLSDKRTTVRDYLGESLKTNYYYMHPRSYNRRAIFSVDEPSSTIRGVNRPIPDTYKIHPADKTNNIKEVRSLSTKERSYLQTFPHNFIFEGSKSNLEQMIGNAVPVKMAQYIAEKVLLKLNE
ncbi:DNA cytosine methyltransferase [Flavobacterium sp. UW10123]|uniref:DNA cytosine methyltransferase n=1 Tax=Flavobacterium sp. UW10123 TaxID=3230800 RepID=UPI00339B30AB